MPTPVAETPGSPAFFTTLHTQFKLVTTAENAIIHRMLADYRFVDEDMGQWDKGALEARAGLPTLQIDRTNGPIRQILNQLSASLPGIKVNPVDNGADIKKAQIRQALIRHIETESEADAVKLQAAEHMVKLGRGFWELGTEWDEDGRYQTIKFFPVENPFSIYYDPAAGTRRPDHSDARFAFHAYDMDLDEYRERFGDDPTGLDGLRGAGDAAADWFPKGKVRVCKYYKVTTTWEKKGSAYIERRAVACYVVNAERVLESYEIPGPYIPIVPVIGERTNINGVIDYKGMVRRAKDSQRMINYERSVMVEVSAFAPRVPWTASFVSVAKYLDDWKRSNELPPPAILLHDDYDEQGRQVTPPTRSFGEPPITAFLQMGREFENDHRAALGFFDVQGQEQRPEQSGKAILARQRQAELGNSHFSLGLARATRLTGKILLHWLPVYFDVPRVMRIIGEDGKDQSVLVHAGQAEAAQQMMTPDLNPDQVYNLSDGRYDVVVSQAPSYQTQRQESRDQLTTWFQSAPEIIAPLGLDMLFKLYDDPVMQELAARAKKMNPALAEESDAQMPIPPQVRQQMQQLLAQHQALTQIVQQQKEQLDTNAQRIAAEMQAKQAELAMKQQAAEADARIEREKAQIQAETARANAQLKADTDIFIAQLEEQTKLKIAAFTAATSPPAEASEASRPGA